MILMDIEKQHPTSKEQDKLADPPRPPQPKCRRRRRLQKVVLHGTAFLLLLVLVRYLTNRNFLVDGPRPWSSSSSSKPKIPLPHRGLTIKEREDLFLSIPNSESALEASRAYATHPHLAGSSEDNLDAKVILHLLQDELGIRKPDELPIYDAGSSLSQNATLLLTTPSAPSHPAAWIDTYYPVLNTGLEQAVNILDDDGSTLWTADLVEDGDPRDPDAHKYRDTIPAWHGLSRDGDVAGQLVYANYGRKEDYDELVAQGANLTGKIVIARYGANFRGLKIKGAQELGAAGVLIYSDPRDDGFVTVKNDYPPYPAGPARNPSSVQRGSVQFLSLYPGDPSTPGYPAYPDAERTEGSNIPNIPSLPISWQNAQRLLEEIGDIYAHKDGKKVLSGKASEKNVRLANHVDTKVTPIWNTMASIPGHIKNEIVLIGCHRDAWVLGAADPTSGTVSLHEIIRVFGALLKKGWKPLRTIVIASWDAEEYGLVGSTEWGEDFAPWISEHVVAYLNVDVSVAGSRWDVGASPSLAHIIQQTALDVPHPTVAGKTLWDALDDEGPLKGLQAANTSSVDPEFMEMYANEIAELKASNTRVRPLGSGSDYTVFLQRLGVASTDQGFGFTPSDPVYHYHSIYDTQAWQERYADRGFHRHVAVARHLGLLALRLIDSIILPLNTTQYALELDDYLDKVQSLVPSLDEKAKEVEFSSLRNAIKDVQEASVLLDIEKKDAEEDFLRLLKRMPFPGRRLKAKCNKRRTGFRRRVADWIKGVFGVSPPTDAELQYLSLRSAESWEEYLEYVVDLDRQFENLEGSSDEEKIDNLPLPFPIRRFIKAAKRVSATNKKLIAFERGFISEDGIYQREWYKHLGVAPGKWLGYGATTFPGLTEAIVYEKDLVLIRHEAQRLETLLSALATSIRP
ncbi:hypothetical protein NLJ89_g5631 [Agrocybe chaxingu]|uniref:Zn-dependent exopeptidase n=1 Tax=Agrocybe chaxingu TaxID=84603 RepID=A0A9W8JZV7_9AGAR|nr:hypothetical protein NLJ89_g5631 [Agrocybe chaxingu]